MSRASSPASANQFGRSHPSFSPKTAPEADYQRLGEGLDKVVAVADRIGLIASFHPHLGTCAQTAEQIAKIFEAERAKL